MMKVAQQLDRPITEIDFENQLKNVVLSGDKEQVEHFLDNNSEFYNTLYDKELVNITISGVRSAYYPEGNLCTALMIAAEHNFTDIVELLIARGAEIDCVNNNSDSAAVIAIAAGSVDVLSLLLDKGVDVNWCDRHGHSLTWVATDADRFEAAQLLLSRGADVNLGGSALRVAFLFHNQQMVRLLLDHGADLHAPDVNDALLDEIVPEEVELLLNRGYDISRFDNKCLKKAIRQKSSKAIKLFIEHGDSLSFVMGQMDRESQERYFRELVGAQQRDLALFLMIGMSYDLAAFFPVFNQMKDYLQRHIKIKITALQQNLLIGRMLQKSFLTSAYNKYLNKVFLATFIEECRTYKAIMLVANRLGRLEKPGLPVLPRLIWRMICEYASRYSFRVQNDHIEKYDHVLEQGKNIMALNPRVAAGIKVKKPLNKVCSLQMKVPPRHSARG